MERYALGDDSAFHELYTVLAPRLYRKCMYLVGRSDAEELLQEVFLKIHRARASFVVGGSVVAWASAIARSTCLDRLRHKRRRPEHLLEPARLDIRDHAWAHCPERAVHESALAAAVSERLSQLSEALRSAYVLVKIEGLSCAEAGAALGISVSAVKQRVHRACEELKITLTGPVVRDLL
jgi:RNA polymerase sigma-70 factor (ECF subfamily)